MIASGGVHLTDAYAYTLLDHIHVQGTPVKFVTLLLVLRVGVGCGSGPYIDVGSLACIWANVRQL